MKKLLKNKFAFILLSTLFLLISSVTSASAASGWQVLKSDRLYWNIDYYKPKQHTIGPVVATDGGYAGLRVYDHTYKNGAYRYSDAYMVIDMWEDDGSAGDDFIGTFKYYPATDGTKIFYKNTDAFRDGSNNKAEVYFRITSYYSTYSSFVVEIVD